MNPEQPSREQIEARITALLLGELPAAEAELLRWTISQDPELQKVHDQLKLTIGFVREAVKNPTGASLERDTPLKLAQDRRQTLLAHFKTARPRPQPPQKLSWLRPIKVSPLISALAVFTFIALLASMLLPVLSASKKREQEVEGSLSAHQHVLSFDNLSQIASATSKRVLENGKPRDGASNRKEPAVTPTSTPIVLPNTESSQAESVENAGTVYSQSVVGHINANTGAKQEFANGFTFQTGPVSGSAGSPHRPQPAPNAETSFAFTPSSQPGASTASPFVNRLQYRLPVDVPSSLPESPAPTQLPEQVPPNSAGGTYNVADLGGEKTPGISAGGGIGGLGGKGASSVINDQLASSWSANANGQLQTRNNSLSDNKRVVDVNRAWEKPISVTNYVAINEPQGRYFGSINDFGLRDADRNQSAPTTRAELNAQTVSDSAAPAPTLGPPQLPRESQIPTTIHESNVVLPPEIPTSVIPQSGVVNEEVTDAARVGPPQLAQQPSNLDKLKYQYAEEGAEIQSMQGEVDQLRTRDHIRDTDPGAPASTPTLSAEQVQMLNEKLVEQKALTIKLEKELYEFQTIQNTNPTELADVLVTVNPDTVLSGLRDKLLENEQRYVTETNLSPASPVSVSTLGLINTEKQEIKDRVDGIMYGYQAQLIAAETQIAGFTNQLNEIEEENQDELKSGQPYWIAKAKLQNEEDLHKVLAEKIEADEADAAMPRLDLVTIVNPAQQGQSQNLWQRLTGTFESKASIEIQPDISSSGTHAEYAPYDPYFMETEVKSIQSDAVLGKVVDSLKLDQAWTKPNNDEKLSRKDTIAQLRSRLDLESDRNTKLIDIGVKSDKPDEAANIANAVAEAYRQYRLETHSNGMVVGIERLKQQYAGEEKDIRQMQAKLQPVETPISAGNADRPLTPPPANAPIPQPEFQTSDNAFSTFSMNVSDVSFKLAMASLQMGRMPEPASIRSEEFINAFDYHDPEPLQGEPLAFVSERAADPFAQERDVLRFSVKAAASGRQDGRALNLVLLLDTSGSMERSDRVAIIREALRVLSAQLQPQDVVSVVTFARTARLWADGIPGNQAAATLDKVGSITPEGGTNLEEAMRLAYETALRHFIASGMNRVVMLTDGAANLGNVDPQALTQKVDAERRQGIALDCFGIGWDDYNDDLLEQLSSNGDGRYAFINSPDEAATEFAAKLAGALQVAAEDVKVQVEFNPSRATAWRQIGYAKHQLTKEQFRDNTVAAGAIAAREAGNALYVVETNPNGEGPIATVRVRYRVPGTQDVQERSWLVDYTGGAPELAQSSPAMRLAVTAAEISEWMADSPFAQGVTPDELLNYLSGVPQLYGTDERPKQLEWMIREAKSASGK